jgi:hypothetical protein
MSGKFLGCHRNAIVASQMGKINEELAELLPCSKNFSWPVS